MYVNSKRKTGNVRLLLKAAGEQVRNYMEEVKVLRELADVIVRQLLIIFEES